MHYASRADLERLYGPEIVRILSDIRDSDDPPSEDQARVLADEKIEEALGAADAEINAYITVKYALPLKYVPPVLKQFARNIAIYHLALHDRTEEMRVRYEDAIKFLQAIGTGKAALPPDPAAPVADLNGDGVDDAPLKLRSKMVFRTSRGD
jgi:phage gp36-like protein